MSDYPMRINKYLAHKGYSTRKGADELITSQKVLINGVVAKLGDKVLETDKIEVRGKHTKKDLVYFAYNKPMGIVTSNPQGDEEDILSTLHLKVKVFPVGRLDKESHGLIILTNDGRITDRLLNPENKHEKEYAVRVDKSITPGFLKHMSGGLDMGEYKSKKAAVKKITNNSFSIVLTEGKNRQIRNMTEKLGYNVTDLKRIRVQNIKLGTIPAGKHKELVGEERTEFLKSLGLRG